MHQLLRSSTSPCRGTANASVDAAYAEYEHAYSAGALSSVSGWSRLSPRTVKLIGGMCDPNFDTRWTVEQAKGYLLVEADIAECERESKEGSEA